MNRNDLLFRRQQLTVVISLVHSHRTESLRQLSRTQNYGGSVLMWTDRCWCGRIDVCSVICLIAVRLNVLRAALIQWRQQHVPLLADSIQLFVGELLPPVGQREDVMENPSLVDICFLLHSYKLLYSTPSGQNIHTELLSSLLYFVYCTCCVTIMNRDVPPETLSTWCHHGNRTLR